MPTPHPRKTVRTGICRLLLLSMLLSACFTGCAKSPQVSEAAEPTPEEIIRQADPSSWDISPEAQHLYYYLLLSDALRENNQDLIIVALQGLLKLEPSLVIYRDSATMLLAQGKAEAAAQVAAEGLRHFPKDTLLTILLAGAYSENEDDASAVALLEGHLKAFPKAYDAVRELIRLYIKTGRRAEAAALLERLPKTDNSPPNLLFRAKVLGATGKIRESKAILQQLVKKDPDNEDAWTDLGFIAENEKNFPEAVRAYKRAADINPENLELWYRIAGLQLDMQQPDEAFTTLLSAPQTASLLLQSALRFAGAGSFAHAETLLNNARANGADPDEVSLYLSFVRMEATGDPQQAIQPLESVRPQSPLYFNAVQRKVHLLLQADNAEAAYKAASTARKNQPERKEFWTLEAFVLLKMNKPDEAEALLRKSLKTYPDDEELRFSLGGLLDESGKKEEALALMESIIASNPNHAGALNYIGYTLAEENRELERAFRLITAALKQQPDADYIVDSLAWVQYRMGKYEDAWKSIRRCIELGGEDPTIWEHYADIALALGKKDEAIKGYMEAIQRKAKNSDALLRKLEALQKNGGGTR